MKIKLNLAATNSKKSVHTTHDTFFFFQNFIAYQEYIYTNGHYRWLIMKEVSGLHSEI